MYSPFAKIHYLCNEMITADELYMKRCLQLARFAEGRTSPNPMVGAVVVHDGKIMGEGYHHRAGLPHAEPNAIGQVSDDILRQSTLYVSLEPCSHWGKTPPCADLIIRKQIPRVVIAMLDPNPLVAGRGIKMMQDAGIDVKVGVLENEARELNHRFLTAQEKHRPYVMLKWAQTADGFIDALRTEPGNGPVKISNPITKALNHKIRTEEGAIMVATRTALLDNPHLTVTKWSGKSPVRLLLDMNCRVPATQKIFDPAARTVVFTSSENEPHYHKSIKTLTPHDHITIVPLDCSQPLPPQVLAFLHSEKIDSVIIEGGTQWLQTFIDLGLWDEARIETSSAIINSGVKAPVISGITIATDDNIRVMRRL